MLREADKYLYITQCIMGSSHEAGDTEVAWSKTIISKRMGNKGVTNQEEQFTNTME